MSILDEELFNLLNQSLSEPFFETELGCSIIDVVSIVKGQLSCDSVISLHIEDSVILSCWEHTVTWVVVVRLTNPATAIWQGNVVEELPLADSVFHFPHVGSCASIVLEHPEFALAFTLDLVHLRLVGQF